MKSCIALCLGMCMVLKFRDILQEFHGSAFGGHSGVNKTREAINSRYWWLGLTEDVKNYIRSCEARQKSDPLRPARKPELQQIKNAECVIKGIPTPVIRQVHCRTYREYIKAHLLQAGTCRQETLCDMPGCNMKQGVCRWVQCCVCGGWFHTKCCGLYTKAALEDNFECCFCIAMYR